MTAIQLLRNQLKWAHDTQEATVADLTADVAHFTKTQSALPAGAAYAHSVWGEDMVLSSMLTHKDPLYKTENTGLSEPMPEMSEWEKHSDWAKSVKIDLEQLHEYAQKVYQQTDNYLASLTDADLDAEYDMTAMGMGKQTIAFVIENFIILHIANLTGEISAAKGFQGLKGYPF